jgi:hypothetical protein
LKKVLFLTLYAMLAHIHLGPTHTGLAVTILPHSTFTMTKENITANAGPGKAAQSWIKQRGPVSRKQPTKQQEQSAKELRSIRLRSEGVSDVKESIICDVANKATKNAQRSETVTADMKSMETAHMNRSMPGVNDSKQMIDGAVEASAEKHAIKRSVCDVTDACKNVDSQRCMDSIEEEKRLLLERDHLITLHRGSTSHKDARRQEENRIAHLEARPESLKFVGFVPGESTEAAAQRTFMDMDYGHA